MPEEVDIVEVVRDLYKMLDDVLVAQQGKLEAKGHKFSCGKGCSYCCYMLTSITIPEGLYIASGLLKRADWKSFVPKLIESVKAHDYKGIEKRVHLLKQIPCPFLQEDKTCGVYEHRPSVCRYHISLDDPEKCGPKNPDTQIKFLDTMVLQEEVWKLAKHYSDATNTETMNNIAPIATMTLFCLRSLLHEMKSPDFEEIEKLCVGVQSPAEWITKHLGSLMAGDS